MGAHTDNVILGNLDTVQRSTESPEGEGWTWEELADALRALSEYGFVIEVTPFGAPWTERSDRLAGPAEQGVAAERRVWAR